MKAWRISQHGGPEVLLREDRPKPEAGPLQAVVRVKAVGLNRLDLWVRKGVPGHKFPLPLIPGTDSVGIVESLGAGSDELATSSGGPRVGETVIVSPGISCGRCEACLGGFDPVCPQYGILGETRDGGLADFVCVPYVNLIRKPSSLSDVEAAALPIPYLTAWTMIERRAQVKAGDFILIQAGGSGVSVAATQLCKLRGATVITTVGSDAKAALSRAQGADHVINYRAAPFRDELKKILSTYGRRGVDVVLDHVGSDVTADSIKSLVWGGRMVICGATSGSDVQIDLKQIFFKNIALMGATMGSKADLIRLVNLAGLGRVKPVIDSTFDMSKLPAAMDRLDSRAAFGKIVVTAEGRV